MLRAMRSKHAGVLPTLPACVKGQTVAAPAWGNFEPSQSWAGRSRGGRKGAATTADDPPPVDEMAQERAAHDGAMRRRGVERRGADG